ncbi:phosphate signaling complex protein PhoU [Corynebacterium pelargi]|uniref:PhoU domain-containing protein n=1 Tax=Corynebacterium pelargi TaxID=1471400 RepID=A0A410W6Z6_9CORY|nr:phosphate signaling complex protein PhoU [Corynebacterium pelargi]QAU51735.1 hypothetical protein CPELA_02185 [Corynebacterium pelargi]GGG80863.1 phosphate transport system regulatory protein PhoU [Corynebacterium pelargi]
MRTAYREHLDAFANDVNDMCNVVIEVLRNATHGLSETSLQSAEQALSLGDELKELKQRSTSRAFQLLALEGPVARDLRQILSSIYIIEDLDRMASLAKHIASTARRRYPEPVIADPVMGYFREMGRLCLEMAEKLKSILENPDADVALVFSADDDAVDDLHDHLMGLLSNRPWPYGTRAAVDCTLIARFFERFADHTVAVAGQIVYLATGLSPHDYRAKRSEGEEQAEIERRFEELERQFSNFDWPKAVD